MTSTCTQMHTAQAALTVAAHRSVPGQCAGTQAQHPSAEDCPSLRTHGPARSGTATCSASPTATRELRCAMPPHYTRDSAAPPSLWLAPHGRGWCQLAGWPSLSPSAPTRRQRGERACGVRDATPQERRRLRQQVCPPRRRRKAARMRPPPNTYISTFQHCAARRSLTHARADPRTKPPLARALERFRCTPHTRAPLPPMRKLSRCPYPRIANPIASLLLYWLSCNTFASALLGNCYRDHDRSSLMRHFSPQHARLSDEYRGVPGCYQQSHRNAVIDAWHRELHLAHRSPESD